MTYDLLDKLGATADPLSLPQQGDSTPIPQNKTENKTSHTSLSKVNPSLNVTPNHTVHVDLDTPLPVSPPQADAVILHIKATGICGSDLHFWKDGAIGHLTVDGTYILGHEASGVVLECGSAVKDLRPGDRVAIEPGVSCGLCYVCLEGNYHLCTEQKFAGVYPYQGTLQRYLTHPSKWCHKIPDSITFAQASLLEPLSVVLHAFTEVSVNIGRGVAICGAGPVRHPYISWLF